MRSLPASELKSNLSAVLGDVERGATIDITRHGRTVARLVPPTAADAQTRRDAAIAWILENKRSGRRTGITVEDILSARDEGRP